MPSTDREGLLAGSCDASEQVGRGAGLLCRRSCLRGVGPVSIGRPQCGQAGVLSEMLFPQPGHVNRGILAVSCGADLTRSKHRVQAWSLTRCPTPRRHPASYALYRAVGVAPVRRQGCAPIFTPRAFCYGSGTRGKADSETACPIRMLPLNKSRAHGRPPYANTLAAQVRASRRTGSSDRIRSWILSRSFLYLPMTRRISSPISAPENNSWSRTPKSR